MKLYLLNFLDEDQVQAEIEDKRGADALIDLILSPSMMNTTLEAAQAAAVKLYEAELEELNEGAYPEDRVGPYELDWQVNEAGNVWNAVQPKPFTAGEDNWRFRISLLEIVT